MIAFQNASESEVGAVLDWAAEEGWNPGLEDASAFFAADPLGFFLAMEQQTPVAAISVVNHTDAFAFLGLYIVRPEYRGRGIGLRLWQHAMAHAGQRTVGLDGVEDQQENYAVSGFCHAGATTRFSGAVGARVHPEVRQSELDDIVRLIDFEAKHSGVRKPEYLHAWFQQTDTRKTIVAESKNEISGFCTVRQCRLGAKVGPLVAETPEVAEMLMTQAAAQFDGDLIVDVPDISDALSALCADFGMMPGFRTARMYRGPFEPGAKGLFAVASLELG